MEAVIPETVYMVGDSPEIIEDILYMDSASYNEGLADGFSLCGQRTFSVNATEVLSLPSQGNTIDMYLSIANLIDYGLVYF